MNSPETRFQAALRTEKPVEALLTLAQELRDEGMSQTEMYTLFDGFRAIHQNDADETRFDAILDTMDCIVGWGSPAARLYETDFRPENE